MNTADHIVEASLGLFYRHGFHASGVDLLSQEAGVTKRTLYRHFPSKDLLIEAALALRHRQFLARIKAFVEAVPPKARPLAYIDFIAAWVAEDDFHGCAFINAAAEFAPPEDPPHQQAAAHKQDLLDYLVALCAGAGAKDPEAVGRSLLLLGEGLTVSCQVMGVSDPLIAAARQTARAILVQGPRS